MTGKMLNMLIGIAVVLVIASSAIYRVTEIERVVLLRFGELIAEDVRPGLHLKIPLVDAVRRFDARVLTVDSPPQRYFTSEQEILIVDSYAKFRVSDVGNYYRATGGVESVARQRLQARINDGLRNEFSSRTRFEVVSGERDLLMQRLTESLNISMRDVLGVEVLDVRVRTINLPEDISDAVFSRMRADREKIARETRAEGEEEAEKIRADADRQRVLVEAEAFRLAEEIRGAGDATAAGIYAASYGQDPEFYAFLRSLQAYRSSFNSSSDLLLVDPRSEFFRYLTSGSVKN